MAKTLLVFMLRSSFGSGTLNHQFIPNEYIFYLLCFARNWAKFSNERPALSYGIAHGWHVSQTGARYGLSQCGRKKCAFA
jgi:hypothetical protein